MMIQIKERDMLFACFACPKRLDYKFCVYYTAFCSVHVLHINFSYFYLSLWVHYYMQYYTVYS